MILISHLDYTGTYFSKSKFFNGKPLKLLFLVKKKKNLNM